MKVDQETGVVLLSNGHSIDPECTHDSFMSSELGLSASAYDCGTPPWIHYKFDGGLLAGHELLASICFYDQVLIYCQLSVSLYPLNQRGWEYYSLDIEADQKRLHETHLEEQLGPSDTDDQVVDSAVNDLNIVLRCRRMWNFGWGKISSIHDSKGGGTFIRLDYQDRMVRANNDFDAKENSRN